MSKPEYKVGDKILFDYPHYGIHNEVGEIIDIDFSTKWNDYTIANNISRCWVLSSPYKTYKYGIYITESNIIRKVSNKENIE